MKKVYLQPSVFVHEIKSEAPLLAGTTKGTGGEEHGGGGSGTDNQETTPTIGGTGDDDDLILG